MHAVYVHVMHMCVLHMYIHCYGVCERGACKSGDKCECIIMRWLRVAKFCHVYFEEFQPKLLLTPSDSNLSDTPGGKGAQEGASLT